MKNRQINISYIVPFEQNRYTIKTSDVLLIVKQVYQKPETGTLHRYFLFFFIGEDPS